MKYGGYSRWPTKPAADDRCEAHVGWEPDAFGMPLLRRCDAPATETAFVSETLFVAIYLCDRHAHRGFRNPRRKQAVMKGEGDG